MQLLLVVLADVLVHFGMVLLAVLYLKCVHTEVYGHVVLIILHFDLGHQPFHLECDAIRNIIVIFLLRV